MPEDLTPAKIAMAAYVDQTAAILELPLPPAVRAQVIAQFAHIHEIAQPLLTFDLPDAVEPAPIFKP